VSSELAEKNSTGRAGARKRNVRQELIDEGLRILAEDGLSQLTLRRVAAGIGVSHAAPAHHFRGLPHMLGAICAVGFARLAREMADHLARAEDDPHARLRAVCEGYIVFSQENTGLITLMFNTNRAEVETEAIGSAGQEAYAILKGVCAPFEPIGPEPDSTETLVWSLVHGFSLLQIGGRFDNRGRSTAHPSFAGMMPRLTLRNKPIHST